jgi:hypothetical protein
MRAIASRDFSPPENLGVRNSQRSRLTISDSTAYASYPCENHTVGRFYQQTPILKIEQGNYRFDGWS